MRVVKQSFEIWGEAPRDYVGACKFMEKAGRLCWASEDKITDTSYEPFLNKIMMKGHTSVLAMSGLGVRNPDNSALNSAIEGLSIHEMMERTKYLDLCVEDDREDGGVFGSVRAFHNVLGNCKTIFDLWAAIDPDPNIEIPVELRRVAVLFETSRSVSHQLVRHTVASCLQSSQRYIDHSNPRMIKPTWFYGKEQGIAFDDWERGQERACDLYRTMRDYGLPKQQARSVLPNATATKVLMMMRVKDWWRFLGVRTAPGADPDMIDLVGELKCRFIDYPRSLVDAVKN